MYKIMKKLLAAPGLLVLSACASQAEDALSGIDTKPLPVQPQTVQPQTVQPQTVQPQTVQPQTVSFLAFGDGGYNPAYPRKKDLKKPRSRLAFIQKEREDWLSDHRPESEFDHSPLTVIPGTQITVEDSGALAVGSAMAQLCRLRACDFAVQLGDNIYPEGADADDGKNDETRMNDLILSPLKPLLQQNPQLVVYSALGNHDWKSSRKGVALQIDWMSRQPQFRMDEPGYYRYTIGAPGQDVEFFVLDTNLLLSGQSFYDLSLNPDGSEQSLQQAMKNGSAELEQHKSHEQPVNGEDRAQLAWLEKRLGESTARWKIVYGHHILWSIGGTKYSEGHVLRKLLLPSLCQYADAYIAGHEHDLELLTDDCSRHPNPSGRPLPLIISGAASKMRGKHSPFAEYQKKTYPEYKLLWSKSFTWGFAHLELNSLNDQLKVDFFSTPKDAGGALVSETGFTFARRSGVTEEPN